MQTNIYPSEQVRLCELADQKEAEKRQFLATETGAIKHALLTYGTAREGKVTVPASASLMADVVLGSSDAPLQKLLDEIYAMVAREDSPAAIGGAVAEFVRRTILLAAEKAWQAHEDGEDGRVFIPGVRHG